MSITTDRLREALVAGDGIVRIHAELSPAAGQKVLPPTYAETVHNMTAARSDGSSEWCSLDSPASFANRVEAALCEGFPELAPLRVQIGSRTLSTLQMPHRTFDATLRESELDGVKWEDTAICQRIRQATPADAYALFKYDPGMVLLGGWDSTRLGRRAQATREAKYPASLSCEIIARDVLPLQRAGSRMDPLGIEGTEASVVEHADGSLEPYDAAVHGEIPVRPEKETDVYPRRVKPSQVNLGNVKPSLKPKGVLVRGGIALDGVLDLRRLGGYRFAPVDDIEARLLLALMGLYGVDSVLRRGLDLRRDCELIATSASYEVVRFGGAAHGLDLGDISAALAAQLAALRDHISEPVNHVANSALRSLAGAV